MKFKLTLIVFKEGQNQGEIDVIAEYASALDAIRGVAQLGAANSLLFSHPDVKGLLQGVGPKALARIHERMGEGCVVQIKEVVEYNEPIPEALRRDPHLRYHVAASRPKRAIPTEGILEPVRDGQDHNDTLAGCFYVISFM